MRKGRSILAGVLCVFLFSVLPLAAQGSGSAADFDAAMACVREKRVADLKALVRGGLDLQMRSADGWGILCASAAMLDDAELFRLLKEKGADLAEISPLGDNALNTAFSFRNLAAARILLDLGVSPAFRSAAGYSVLHHAAAQPGTDRLLMKRLCDAVPASHLKATDRYGMTPMAAAVMAGNTAAMEALLGAYVFLDETAGTGGFAPIHWAAAHEEALGSLKFLIARKAFLETRTGAGGQMSEKASVGAKQTPLMVAVAHKNLPAAQALLAAGADPAAKDSSGHPSILHQAIFNGLGVELVRAILDADPSLISAKALMGTPLHYALHLNKPDAALVRLLLERGADINALDGGYQTPLDYGLKWSKEGAILQELLKRGAKVFSVKWALEALDKNEALKKDPVLRALVEEASLK